MALSTEAIIGIAAVVLALPSALIILWRWRRSLRREEFDVYDAEMQMLPSHAWHLSPRPSFPRGGAAARPQSGQYQQKQPHECKEFYYVAVYQGSVSR